MNPYKRMLALALGLGLWSLVVMTGAFLAYGPGAGILAVMLFGAGGLIAAVVTAETRWRT